MSKYLFKNCLKNKIVCNILSNTREAGKMFFLKNDLDVICSEVSFFVVFFQPRHKQTATSIKSWPVRRY